MTISWWNREQQQQSRWQRQRSSRKSGPRLACHSHLHLTLMPRRNLTYCYFVHESLWKLFDTTSRLLWNSRRTHKYFLSNANWKFELLRLECFRRFIAIATKTWPFSADGMGGKISKTRHTTPNRKIVRRY